MDHGFDYVSANLRAAGLTIRETHPVVLGVTQHRYTLCRRTPHQFVSGDFIAWFCWYRKPAMKREFNPRPAEEHVTEQVIWERLAPEEHRLVHLWLAALHKQHPVTTKAT